MMTLIRTTTLVLIASLIGCGDDEGGGTDAGTDSGTDAGTDSGTDAGTDSDVGDAGNGLSVTIANQNLSDLSTVVTASAVNVTDDAWLVIRADASGSLGAVLGATAINASTSGAVEVALSRPAGASETLHAVLHDEGNNNGTFDGPGAPDGPLMNGSQIVDVTFVTTVAAGTPAVRITLGNNGAQDYEFDQIEPSTFEGIVDMVRDPTLTLEAGLRYQIVNPIVGPHPFELLDNTTSLLSQQTGDNPALESDSTIDFTDSSGTMTFTVSPALVSAGLDGYRCGIHTANMRGAITINP